MMKLFSMESLILLLVIKWVGGVILCNETNSSVLEDDEVVGTFPTHEAFVPLTLINGGAAKGAVCLDGTVPGYHLDRGYGAGTNSWLIQLEGGAWCNSVRSCIYRKKSPLGSSAFMGKGVFFRGILSNNPRENPDFHNWNRVKLRYCDGASFLGYGRIRVAQLNFGGQGIWFAAMEELMSRGMKFAKQALLSGCSAGGLSSIMHCDQFRGLFPATTTVKCLSDGGLFLDVADIARVRNIRNFFNGVVNMQGVKNNLPIACTDHLDPTSCFFPQNVIDGVKTPLFLLNSAYDTWQIQSSLTPQSADPRGYWKACRLNMAACSSSQLQFLQNFRLQMLHAVDKFSRSNKNGLFINSCFAHCQTENDRWFLAGSSTIGKRSIAAAVGNWYFDRAAINIIDCPYPCGKTSHNLSCNPLLASFGPP